MVSSLRATQYIHFDASSSSARWCPFCLMVHATSEVHPVFSEVPRFGSLRLPPKTDLGENKTAAG